MTAIKQRIVFWFVILTVALSFGAYYLPLPVDSKSLLVPVILVFIPTAVCLLLVLLAEGKNGLRQLFRTVRGAWMWILIGAAAGALMRLVVLLSGLVLGMSIKVDLSGAGTWFIILTTIPLAWFEELGWRRFALERTLDTRSPFEAALLLGIPWGIIHLVVLLPGMMSAGAPAIPQSIALIALGFILTWAYIRSHGSLLAVTLLHGVQNGLIILNRGISISESTWLMMGVYLILAAFLVLFERRLFFTVKTPGS